MHDGGCCGVDGAKCHLPEDPAVACSVLSGRGRIGGAGNLAEGPECPEFWVVAPEASLGTMLPLTQDSITGHRDYSAA